MVMLTDLADVLRRAGLTVVEMPGWKTRANNGDPANFRPRGMMMHHDAMALGWNDNPADDLNVPRNMIRPGQGGANLWYRRDGAVFVLAAGPMPHAGSGQGFRGVPAGRGNQACASTEVDITLGMKWTELLYRSVALGSAALNQHYGWTQAGSCTHAEYAPGRKVDPDRRYFDPDRWRADLVRPLAELQAKYVAEMGQNTNVPKPPVPFPAPVPTPIPSEEDDMKSFLTRIVEDADPARVYSIRPGSVHHVGDQDALVRGQRAGLYPTTVDQMQWGEVIDVMAAADIPNPVKALEDTGFRGKGA